MCRHDVFTLQVPEDIHYSSCINIRNLGLCWSNCNMNTNLSHVLSACREHVWLVCLSELSHVLSACREHRWLVCLSELAHVHISHCRFQKLCKILANSLVSTSETIMQYKPLFVKGHACAQHATRWCKLLFSNWSHHTHIPMTVWWCKTLCS